MQIVTAGKTYLDIDAYAGIIAYAELLNAQHIPAKAISTATPNASVSPIVRSWGSFIEQAHTPQLHDQFTLIDVSAPDFFDSIVKHSQVKQIIDHHMEYKAMWEAKLGDKAHIEFVGAACTLVYEHWVQAGVLREMKPTTAGLLMCGILDNTLNFGAVITTDRDREAYEQLATIANLPGDWPAKYFTDCQQIILADIHAALADDTKNISYPLQDESIYVGQLAFWDAAEALEHHLDDIRNFFEGKQRWYINIISLKDNRSYFLSEDTATQSWVSSTLDVSFDKDLAIANRMWLRKEIMQRATTRSHGDTPKV